METERYLVETPGGELSGRDLRTDVAFARNGRLAARRHV